MERIMSVAAWFEHKKTLNPHLVIIRDADWDIAFRVFKNRESLENFLVKGKNARIWRPLTTTVQALMAEREKELKGLKEKQNEPSTI